MKIAVDTNILVRAVVGDDPGQSRSAATVLRDAETVAVSSAVLCELVWVLRSTYAFDRATRAMTIRRLLGAANVVADGPAAEAGLAMLDAGGDFADGVIAHEGAMLGGETFVSFDKRAVALATRQGLKAKLVAA